MKPHEMAGDQEFTHGAYLLDIRKVLALRLNAPERDKLLAANLLYGAGSPHVYGTCFYDRWTRDGIHDLIEISAFGEESAEQLWVTVAHECAHVLAPRGAGHGVEWKAAARRLGLRRPAAVGHAGVEDLDPALVELLRQIPSPQDGRPINRAGFAGGKRVGTISGPPCPLGIGTAGGTSRGPGSGSRLRLYVCQCERPVRVRVASNDFLARCLVCNASFKRAETRTRAPVAEAQMWGAA
jgi:hypothetical protein